MSVEFRSILIHFQKRCICVSTAIVHRSMTWIALCLFMLGCTSATIVTKPEPIKVFNCATIDAKRILAESTVAANARKRLEAEFSPRDKELTEMMDAVILMQAEEIKNRDKENFDANDMKQKITEQRKIIRAKQTSFRKDLKIRRNEEFKYLKKELALIVVDVARGLGFNTVVTANGALLYSAKGKNVQCQGSNVSITKEVLDEIAVKHPIDG